MPRRLRLRSRLLLGYLAVIAIGTVTLLAVVGFVAPGAFETAMGPSMPGMGGMMSTVIRAAFSEAVRTAMVVAVLAAMAAAVVISIALAARISGPITRMAAASRRIAAGRYTERVPVASSDEIGDLAGSFNQMAEALESTERRRLQLVGDVAHELRTPLATLDGYLEGLQDGVIQPADPTWRLLRDETARLSRLINDLQELWRAEANQLALSPARVDVAAALTAASERFTSQARERGSEISMTVAGGLAVQADAERLAQVLDNLLTNALRYSPDGAPVSLEARADGAEVLIDIVDMGPGLTEEQRELVFERFYRVDPSRARALGGSGIGLAIARALTLAMGGRIWAESQGPDRGSTFRLALPRAS